jgi:AraC-like DNA-binding protein
MPTNSSRFLGGGEILPDPNWRMSAHSHPFHELIVVMRGKMHLRINGSEITATAGDLLLYQAGTVHEERSVASAPVNTFFIAFNAASHVVSDFRVTTNDADGRVRQMIRWMIRDHTLNAPPAQQNGLLAAILGELRRLQLSPSDPWWSRTIAFMRENLGRDIYLDELAHRAGMSKFAFVRRFRRIGGRSPMKELQSMRLQEAHTLVLSSNAPMRSIAAQVGLGDEFQLSRLFRRQFGTSPRGIRVRPSRRD